jgi:hypothetical protein
MWLRKNVSNNQVHQIQIVTYKSDEFMKTFQRKSKMSSLQTLFLKKIKQDEQGIFNCNHYSIPPLHNNFVKVLVTYSNLL